MKKNSHGAMERLMTRSNKSKKSNNKQFLMNAIIGIGTLFLVSAVISFLLTSPSVQNLATVLPHKSVGMMSSPSRPFITSFQESPGSRKSSSSSSTCSRDMNAPSSPSVISTSNTGPMSMFAHALNSRMNDIQPAPGPDAERVKIVSGEGNDVISLDSDLTLDGALAYHMAASRNKQNKYSDEVSINYNYYYYDSSSQAFHLHDYYTTYPDKPSATASSSHFQRSLSLSNRYLPSLCKDGHTYGFSDLGTLRNAIHELSDAYSDTVSRWEHYNAALSEYKLIKAKYSNIESPPPLPEHLTAILETEPDPFVICPRATLRSPLGRHMTIHINAEDVLVQCDSCVIDTPGTHFSFGQYAKNVRVKGITLMGATESSIIFRQDGADAVFENCYWVNNKSVGIHGAVADMNSTSTLQFYSCEISDVKHSSSPRTGMHGGSTAASSLTLRG